MHTISNCFFALAMFVMIGNMLIQLPFLYVMPKLFGITGVWIAFPLSNIALSLVVAVMLYKDVRKMLLPNLKPLNA